MRIIIAGSRTFRDYKFLKSKCDRIITFEPECIISGLAQGPDRMAIRYAAENNYRVLEFPADWDKYGRKAGYLRNVEMARAATHLIAFWDGKSRGTKHMIDIARDHGLTVRVIRYDKQRA